MNATTIRNTYEKRFQDHLMKELKHIGVGVIHLEPVGHAGFPDLLVTKDNLYLLVELKSIATAETGETFGSIFETGQLAWHATRVQNGDWPVLTLIECRDDGTVYVFTSHIARWYIDCADMKIRDLFPSLEARTPFFLADWLASRI